MDEPEPFITLPQGIHDDAKSQDVVNLIQAEVLVFHFVVDAVEMFMSAPDCGRDIGLLQLLAEYLFDFLDKLFPCPPSFGDACFDLLIDRRFKVVKTEVFQSGLDPVNTDVQQSEVINREAKYKIKPKTKTPSKSPRKAPSKRLTVLVNGIIETKLKTILIIWNAKPTPRLTKVKTIIKAKILAGPPAPSKICSNHAPTGS